MLAPQAGSRPLTSTTQSRPSTFSTAWWASCRRTPVGASSGRKSPSSLSGGTTSMPRRKQQSGGQCPPGRHGRAAIWAPGWLPEQLEAKCWAPVWQGEAEGSRAGRSDGRGAEAKNTRTGVRRNQSHMKLYARRRKTPGPGPRKHRWRSKERPARDSMEVVWCGEEGAQLFCGSWAWAGLGEGSGLGEASTHRSWHFWSAGLGEHPCPTLSVSPSLQAGGKRAAGDCDRRLGDAGRGQLPLFCAH